MKFSKRNSTTPRAKLGKHVIVGFGNPLLDISAVVSQDVLDKYDLKMNNAILAEEKQMPLYDDLVNNFDVEYVAGGATQNSIRVAQWMSQSPDATVMIGSVGTDKFAQTLKDACSKDGVTSMYYESSDTPTGVCGVLILDKERSLCTRLDAANEYKHQHTLSASVQKVIESAEIFYSASFFLTVPEGPESVELIGKHAAENNKIFAMNLSAEFLIQFFQEPMNMALEYADYVFGNETEAKKFGEVREWDCSIEEVAIRISMLPKKSGGKPRTVVFSQGADPTIVAHNGKVTLYPVPPLASELLVDTNGAGDAFVGGFLAKLVADEPIEECIRCGHYAARTVIMRSGCTLPPQPDI